MEVTGGVVCWCAGRFVDIVKRRDDGYVGIFGGDGVVEGLKAIRPVGFSAFRQRVFITDFDKFDIESTFFPEISDNVSWQPESALDLKEQNGNNPVLTQC